MIALLPLVLLLQQGATQTVSPPGGDTVGYWQQRADYMITAKLDESAEVLHGKATLTYLNHSPDTLRELRVQQLLNAFRPGSRWSAADAREGRVRFQTLKEPYPAYERFTAPPRVNGAAVVVTYPFAPDSTIARFDLPIPLAPGDSAMVEFAWDARPSATVYRRQGRKGRKYDFSQWYPKVAVYDRGGWEAQPFIPNGEMYGEFGTFDVTLDLAADQVVGATGVPVAGDPGWEKARSGGEVHYARGAYGAVDTSLPNVGAGRKAVRFYARDVHHFGWATDPEFKYEETMYRGSIPIHVLIPSAQLAKLGHGVFVSWNAHALEFLEKIYGPYAYPQLTGLIRLDAGATEFPMMAMYGSSVSEGTVSHEVGHIYSYGMLGNNEWREGWLDEGLTSYQSEWRIRETPQDVGESAPQQGTPPATGYRAHAHVMGGSDRNRMSLYDVDLLGRAEAPENATHAFNEFNIYQMGVYSRPDLMYGMLRDMLGDSAFTAFLHDYYARWKFKHVDELAMRASAERVSGGGRDLGWFFEQWVHRTGLVDYALANVETRHVGDAWVTRAKIERRGEYRHAMPVGAREGSEWTIVRGDPARDAQWVEIRTARKPEEVRLDPLHSTEDWDRRNDAAGGFAWFDGHRTIVVPDWPFLAQTDRNRNLIAVAPRLWYTGPGGLTGALRFRSNYSTAGDVAIDKRELGIALSSRVPDGARGIEHLQGWATIANPRFGARPIIGLSAGAWMLDGIAKFEAAKEWNLSQFLFANGPLERLRIAADGTLPYDTRWLDFNRWQPADVYDLNAEYSWRARMPASLRVRVKGFAGIARPSGGGNTDLFERFDGEIAHVGAVAKSARWTHKLRLFAGASDKAPLQRSIGLSSLDVTDTYADDFVRGRDALFARSDVHYAMPGGAGLRGYSPLLRVDNVAALNGEVAATVLRERPKTMVPTVQAVAFADLAIGRLLRDADTRSFADAGVGLLARDQLWDRRVTLRFDVPLFVYIPAFAPGAGAGDNRIRLRWTFSFADLW